MVRLLHVNRRRRGGIVWALCSLLVLEACSSDGDVPRSVTAADAYVAVIRWYVAQAPQPPPSNTADSDPQPTHLYILSTEGNTIDAQDQATVVAELADISDSVMVVFADTRDEAVDLEVVGEPVKDQGALLLVGNVEEGQPPVDLSLQVYRSADDHWMVQMQIVRDGLEEFSVSDVTELAQS